MDSRSFANGNGPGAGGDHAAVVAVGPAQQGQPWPDGHWWWIGR